MSEQQGQTDRARDARVRLLQAGIARLILAIPADCSKHSRAIRLGQIRNKSGDFWSVLVQRQRWEGGDKVITHPMRETDAWVRADVDAWMTVKAALDAGDDLAAFLFPSEATS